jgi:hypothetical protein
MIIGRKFGLIIIILTTLIIMAKMPDMMKQLAMNATLIAVTALTAT